MVEHAAVNRVVEGSSPSSGAISKAFIFKGNSRGSSQKTSFAGKIARRFPRFSISARTSAQSGNIRAAHKNRYQRMVKLCQASLMQAGHQSKPGVEFRRFF